MSLIHFQDVDQKCVLTVLHMWTSHGQLFVSEGAVAACGLSQGVLWDW